MGGGINGLAIAWLASQQNYTVTLFERGDLMSQTSAASTKLLHGGLRYLEYGRLSLVREALRERQWWLSNCPAFTRVLPVIIPVYQYSKRSRAKIKTGLFLYDYLAGKSNLQKHTWLNRDDVIRYIPELKVDGLAGGYLFRDGQMDDRQLGLWVAEQAVANGAYIRTQSPVQRINTDGFIFPANDQPEQFDYVINAAGPWAEQLLQKSAIVSKYGLDLVRGSHLLLDQPISAGLLLQHPEDGRIFFILPYKDRTLLGTTEVLQSIHEPITCSEEEMNYLLAGYFTYMSTQPASIRVESSFAGLRPLVRSNSRPEHSNRECKLELNKRLLTVWGGKWTTARSLALQTLKLLAAKR